MGFNSGFKGLSMAECFNHAGLCYIPVTTDGLLTTGMLETCCQSLSDTVIS